MTLPIDLFSTLCKKFVAAASTLRRRSIGLPVNPIRMGHDLFFEP